MSNISSDSLFHFTSKAEYLIGILKNDFIPRYCYEEIILNKKLKMGKMQGAIPMVCFCDISLGQITSHLSTYGSYGIGMTKEWAIKNRLNPIIYVNENSKVADKIVAGATNIRTIMREENDPDEETLEVCSNFLDLTDYIKPYKGDFVRNGKLMRNVKFYNEREWRYLPDWDWGKDGSQVLVKEDFKNPIKLAQENSKLEKYKLSFSPSDVKYIFVKDETEIHPMVKALREIKKDKFNETDIDILTSKILTTKQIAEDF